jgi:hypothetical protein
LIEIPEAVRYLREGRTRGKLVIGVRYEVSTLAKVDV